MEITIEVSSDICTADLVEVLDAFVRSMGRSPTGDLDYTVSTL